VNDWITCLVSKNQNFHAIFSLQWQSLFLILEKDCGLFNALPGQLLMSLRGNIFLIVIWKLLFIEAKLNEVIDDVVDSLV